MKISHFAFFGLLPLAACATNTPAAMVAVPVMGAPQISAQDSAFMLAAAQSDAFEIQSSQLALQKSRNPAIKAFAQRMVNEHGTTTRKMMQAAEQKGIQSPPMGGLDPMQTQTLAMLQGESGYVFDRDYLRSQVAGHRMTAQVLQTEIDTGTDPDEKALATAELPMVQDHMRAAQQIRLSR